MKKSELRQTGILNYMRDTISTKGFPPTVREICTALNIKSTSTVHNDLKVLENKGYIKKDPSKPRALSIVNKNKNTAKNELSSFTENQDDDISVVNIPVVGRVAAGTPILSEENLEESIPVPSRFVGKGVNFILTVHGSSMINAGINDGDFLLVKEENTANNGDIVVAMINGEFESEATVKRFFRENGHIRLQPENDTMSPIILNDVSILGKVKGVFRYFN